MGGEGRGRARGGVESERMGVWIGREERDGKGRGWEGAGGDGRPKEEDDLVID